MYKHDPKLVEPETADTDPFFLLLFSLSQWKKSEHGIGISDPQGIIKILYWKYLFALYTFSHPTRQIQSKKYLSEIPPLS